uniref:S-protein homolog n=1 Tax=Cajanus cajan TaxID=3821 RepID=A0A151RWD7_CAJCA|nr:hypothetical protein KK1_031557 [Cajanus cajan]
MALPKCFLYVVLVSFYCLSASTVGRSQTVVDIRNDLPKKSQVQLQLRCGKGSSFNLKLGAHSTLTVGAQDLACSFLWTPFFATLDVYQAQRDKGHRTVYWSVRQDGFYQSSDASNWKFVDRWFSD